MNWDILMQSLLIEAFFAGHPLVSISPRNNCQMKYVEIRRRISFEKKKKDI